MFPRSRLRDDDLSQGRLEVAFSTLGLGLGGL